MTHADGVGSVAIVSVHGTGDGASADEGAKWWQNGSKFEQGLAAALTRHGVKAELHPFHWSGDNSELARARGARALAQMIRKLRGRYASIHLVAHSHGGNVANMAADHLHWGKARRSRSLSSVVAVGTPFLRRRVAWWTYASAVLFVLVSMVGPLAWVMQIASDFPREQAQTLPFWLGFASVVLPMAAAVVLMLAFAVEGLARVSLPVAHLRSNRAILAIRHPQDEAIAFLQQIDGLELEAIPRGALWRGSVRLAGAISAGLASVAVLGLIGFDMVMADNLFGDWSPLHELWLAPVVFCLLYPISRLIFGLLPEWTLRAYFNRRIRDTLRGVALGADGVQRLAEVSPRSHTLATTEVVLDGDLSERMKADAAQQASRLIDKYRWPILSAGADARRALTEIGQDAMTWDSLIHTTYFDQPELSEMIAAHVVASHAAKPDRRDSEH